MADQKEPQKFTSETIKRFLSNVINVLGLFGTLLGIYAFYYRDQKEPTFVTDKTSRVVFEQPDATKLVFYDSSKSQIETNLYSINFYFFNQGEVPIFKTSDVMEDITISLDSDSAEIYASFILKPSRPSIKPTIERHLNEKNTVTIGFRVLEKNDGIAGQIIYKSKKPVTLKIAGDIVGVKTFKTSYNTGVKQYYKAGLSVLGVLLLILVAIPILYRKNFYSHKYRLRVSDIETDQSMTLTFTYGRVVFYSAMMFTLFFLMSISIASIMLSNDDRSNEKPNVPPTLGELSIYNPFQRNDSLLIYDMKSAEVICNDDLLRQRQILN
jgi:hypothetical protein